LGLGPGASLRQGRRRLGRIKQPDGSHQRRAGHHSTSNSNSGWTAGLRAEWAFWGNWSARIEYDFIGLTNQTFVIPTSVRGLPAGDQFTGNNRNIQMVNVGINYKFGPLVVTTSACAIH
jgi:opacity protein-like surface antigen